jgi:hypothetical protein
MYVVSTVSPVFPIFHLLSASNPPISSGYVNPLFRQAVMAPARVLSQAQAPSGPQRAMV